MTLAIVISLFFAAVCAVALSILLYKDHEKAMYKAMKEHDQKCDFRYSFGNLPDNKENHTMHSSPRKAPRRVYSNSNVDSLFFYVGR